MPEHNVAESFLFVAAICEHLLETFQVVFSGVLNQRFARCHEFKELFFVVHFKLLYLVPNLSKINTNPCTLTLSSLGPCCTSTCDRYLHVHLLVMFAVMA